MGSGTQKIGYTVMTKKKIKVVAPCTDFRRWGVIAYKTVTGLKEWGYDVVLDPLYWDFNSTSGSEIAVELNAYRMRSATVKEDVRLLICPTGGRWFSSFVNGTILVTMWDGSEVPQDVVSSLNTTKSIIVPSEYCMTAFSGSGVESKLYVVPFGVEDSFFGYDPNTRFNGKYIFLTCCSGSVRSSRKNVQMVIDAFEQAFPVGDDSVELWVKMAVGAEHIVSGDERVRVSVVSVPWRSMTVLHGKVNCFVSASSCDGWDMNALESMAHGNPLISTRFGGYRDFFDMTVGYELKYNYVREHADWAEGLDSMLQANVSMESLVNNMREARRDDREMRERVVVRAKQYTWERYLNGLERAIEGK